MINLHNNNLDEYLNEIDKIESSDDRVAELKYVIANASHAKFYLEMMTDDVWPDIERDSVAFKKNELHYSMAGRILLNKQTVATIKQAIMNPKVTKRSRVYQLQNMLEMLSDGESSVLLAVLYKDIASICKNITHAEISTALTEWLN